MLPVPKNDNGSLTWAPSSPKNTFLSLGVRVYLELECSCDIRTNIKCVAVNINAEVTTLNVRSQHTHQPA